MKSLLIGSFGADNIGDEFILHSALQKYPNSIVMTANSRKSTHFLETTFETIPPFPTGIRSLLNFKRTQYLILNKKIDQIIFPGGGLFSKSLKAVWIWTLHIWWCKHFFPGKSIVMESQGVDICNNPIGKILLKWSLKNISEITVRDSESQKHIQQICTKKVPVVGDAVENFLKQEKTKKISGKNILINAAKSFNYEHLNKKFDQKKIDFIAFDKKDLKNIPQDFSGKIHIPSNRNETKKIFSEYETFIGQRFHFLILAKNLSGKENTFLLGSPYAPKTAEYQKQNSLKQI